MINICPHPVSSLYVRIFIRKSRSDEEQLKTEIFEIKSRFLWACCRKKGSQTPPHENISINETFFLIHPCSKHQYIFHPIFYQLINWKTDAICCWNPAHKRTHGPIKRTTSDEIPIKIINSLLYVTVRRSSWKKSNHHKAPRECNFLIAHNAA